MNSRVATLIPLCVLSVMTRRILSSSYLVGINTMNNKKKPHGWCTLYTYKSSVNHCNTCNRFNQLNYNHTEEEVKQVISQKSKVKTKKYTQVLVVTKKKEEEKGNQP